MVNSHCDFSIVDVVYSTKKINDEPHDDAIHVVVQALCIAFEQFFSNSVFIASVQTVN